MSHPSTAGIHIKRRDFLRAGSALALASGAAWSREHAPASCILLWQEGGLSHLDSFDPKPGAPPEIRGPFRDIATAAPGLRFSEHLPCLARQADKLTVIRSMQGEDTNHERAAALIAGALPPATVLEPAAARRALALAAESPSLRDRYGRTPLGEACLGARRLVQAGARMVRLIHTGYDTHAGHFEAMRCRVLPEFDRAFAALVEDLEERRLLDRTLVIAAGEFGRSPRINAAAGRDHHARAWSVCLAGAGVARGRVVGATDATGSEVVDSPVRAADLIFSAYTILGIPTSNVGGGRVVRDLLA
ncbi:MAG TPA: DUF1501 domain-containing protein [Bryobacteraceae bacterium]|nr:DUF1501 domain-containing protein [Bryobacteraceae bacterium]